MNAPEPKVGESGLSDEQAVRQKYPQAQDWRGWGDDGPIAIWNGLRGESEQLSGHFKTAEEAWADARARIEAKPEPLPNTHQLVGRPDLCHRRYAELRCSCGRIFVAVGDEALASSRASFEAHLPGERAGMEATRPKPQDGDYRPHYRKDEADAFIERLEYERDVWRDKCKMLAAQPSVQRDEDGIGWCSSCDKIHEVVRPKCPSCGDWLIFAADDVSPTVIDVSSTNCPTSKLLPWREIMAKSVAQIKRFLRAWWKLAFTKLTEEEEADRQSR